MPAGAVRRNLNYLETLAGQHPLVGYSGHERGTAVSVAAVAKGANCRAALHPRPEDGGPDHAASLEYNDFKRLIAEIVEVDEALGEAGERVLSQGEMMNRKTSPKPGRHRPLKGSVVSLNDVEALSPGQGLNPQFLDEPIGKTLKRD